MGNLMSRAFKMSNDVYAAMLARGFTGEVRVSRPHIGSTGVADWRGAGRQSRSCAAPLPRGAAVTAPVCGGPWRPAVGPGEPLFRLRGVRLRVPGWAGRAGRRGPADTGPGSGSSCWARTAAASRRCSSCWTASWRPPAARCGPWVGTWPPSSPARTRFRFHREVGLVFQDPDIQLFSATVLDDVAFGPLQLGLQPRKRCERAATKRWRPWRSRTWPTGPRSSCPAARRSGRRSHRCCRCGRRCSCSTSRPPRWTHGRSGSWWS